MRELSRESQHSRSPNLFLFSGFSKFLFYGFLALTISVYFGWKGGSEALELDAVYVLAGGIKVLPSGKITGGDFTTRDMHGLIADYKSRVEAGLTYYNSNLVYVASGAELPIDEINREKVSYADVYRQYLIEQGIHSNQVLDSRIPICTITELISLVGFAAQYNWNNVIVICDFFQLERTKLLWKLLKSYPLYSQDLISKSDHDPSSSSDSSYAILSAKFFSNRLIYRNSQLLTPEVLNQLKLLRERKLPFNVTILSSREILEQKVASRKIEFDEIYNSPIMQKRLISEKNGIEMILNGTYYIPN